MKKPPRRRTRPRSRPRRASAAKRILATLQDSLASPDFKGTVNDMLRVLELERAIGNEPAHDITVRWISPEKPAPKKK